MRVQDASGRVVSKTTPEGLRRCAGCDRDLPCDIEHFGVQSWADRERRVVRYWKGRCRRCCAADERERIARVGTSPERRQRLAAQNIAWKERERRRQGRPRMPVETYVKRYGRLPPAVVSAVFDPRALIGQLALLAPEEPDPVEALSEGGGSSVLVSLADADYECAHGRIAGDPCPQPEFVPDRLDRPVPNPDRRWPHDEPCGCWGGR